jgi:Flp pilus assembly protein TadB
MELNKHELAYGADVQGREPAGTAGATPEVPLAGSSAAAAIRSFEASPRNAASNKEHTMTSIQHVAESAKRAGGVKRPALWLLLLVSAVCNVVANTADVNPFVGVAFGMITLSCAAALISQHYKNRRATRTAPRP